MKRYEVTRSPWPQILPSGTIVVSEDGTWFKREDGERLFHKGADREYDRTGVFKLFQDEVKIILK